MARGIKVVIDGEGMRELMTSQEMLDTVVEVGNTVAGNAGKAFEAQAWMRPTRAVANVVDMRPNAMQIEAQQGNLARAIGKSGG